MEGPLQRRAIREVYGNLTVVYRIKLARLRWAGHVVRMEMDDG